MELHKEESGAIEPEKDKSTYQQDRPSDILSPDVTI